MSEVVGKPADGVREQTLGDDELSLFDPGTGRAVALNRTARDVWALADGVSTVDEVVATLATAYAVPAAEIDADVRAVLRQMTAAGILVLPEA
jgi:hypothetical protein